MRFGLAVIVILLLFLNFGTTYIFFQGKRQVSEQIDNRVLSGLQRTALAVQKNQTPDIPADHLTNIKQQYQITSILAEQLPAASRDSLLTFIRTAIISQGGVRSIEQKELVRLLEGDLLLLSDMDGSRRTGVQVASYLPGQYVLMTVQTNTPVLAVFANASKHSLILTSIIILLIIPMTIGLPRLILKPFKAMRQAAENAGRLTTDEEGDEVAQILQSYEDTIAELTGAQDELKKLYAASSSKARQLEKINKYILQSIASGIIHIDAAGKVIEYNRAAEEILGYDPSLVLDKHYLTTFPDDDELNMIIDAGISRGQATPRRAIEISRPDGQHFLGVESSKIYDESGVEIGLAVLFNDITEIRKLQSEVEINRRMAALGEMTAGLAHQLRNSLAAISGFAQLLSKKTSENPALSDLASSIREETTTSEKMVSRFLTFARPLSINTERFDLSELIASILEKSRLTPGLEHVSFSFNGGELPLPVNADGMLIKEALCNVIDNACQAVDFEGTVDVAVSVYEGLVNILIADNGSGIDDSIKNDLFTPFVSSRPSGTGLGLALTHKIISLHKGSITFNNRTEGGAVCRISLPILAASDSASEISQVEKAEKKG
ncbi:MAG: ATP-binding protein [Candidatus Zixiibacteriota bacterium]